MKIRTKISIIMVLLILGASTSVTYIIVRDIKRDGKIRLEEYRKRELKRIKQNLINFVDIAYETVKTNQQNSETPSYLEKFYGHRLKNMVDITFSFIKEQEALVKAGKLSKKDAKKEVAKIIRKFRFNESGYLWINSLERPYPKIIMHPTQPELEEKSTDKPEYFCAMGKKQHLLQAAVDVTEKTGEGFINYVWEKPSCKGIIPKVPKLSYVRRYQPWGWIIGVGIYVDDAIDDAKLQSKMEVEKMHYDKGTGYLFLNKLDTECLMHPYEKGLVGKKLLDVKDSKGTYLFVEMSKIAKQQGAGFLEYRWAKPLKNGKTLPNAPKLTYVRLFKPWGWIIGSGVYIDQIDRTVASRQREIDGRINSLILQVLISSGVVIIIALFASFVFADNIAAPIRKLVTAMKQVDLTDLSASRVKLKGSDEIRKLGDIFNNMTDSLNKSLTELQETTIAKERIEGELNVARDIQMSIIPKLFPAFPHREEFEIYALLKTAKAVGGDLYDFFFIEDDKLCFLVGDVSGKGVPASLFMAVTRTLLRARAVAGEKAGDIVAKMNATLCADNDAFMFVTFFLCILDVKTGNVEYCNAGHNLPYIIKDKKQISPIGKLHGPPIGVMEGEEYGTDSFVLKPGDALVLYTDGITEAVNLDFDMFGEERLLETLEKVKGKSPKIITDAILKDVEEFAGYAEQADDITILVQEYKGG